MKECKTLIKSYKQLFELTGRVEFFLMYRTMQKNNQAILLSDKEQELTV